MLQAAAGMRKVNAHKHHGPMTRDLQLSAGHSLCLALLRGSIHLSMQRPIQALRRLQLLLQARNFIPGSPRPPLEVSSGQLQSPGYLTLNGRFNLHRSGRSGVLPVEDPVKVKVLRANFCACSNRSSLCRTTFGH